MHWSNHFTPLFCHNPIQKADAAKRIAACLPKGVTVEEAITVLAMHFPQEKLDSLVSLFEKAAERVRKPD